MMKDLTKGNEALLILGFTIPLFIGNVFQQLYIVIDSIVVGHFLGKVALGAIGACFPLVFLLIAMVMGLTMGASVLISQYYGAKKYELVKRAIDTTYIALFVMGLVMSIGGPLVSTWVLQLMHTPADILPQAKIFIDIFLYGLLLLFGYNTVGSVLRALGDAKTPTFYLIASTIINSVLVSLFVIVFHWGLAGSAIATLIAQGFSFAGLIWHVNRRENELLHFKPGAMVFDWDMFKQIFKLGLPAGVQQVGVAIGMMAIIRLVNNYGTDVIAGFTAASRLDAFALMPAMNLSLAMSTFVGQNIGANKFERVTKGLTASLWIAVLFSLFTTAVVMLWAHPLLSIFTKDPVLLDVGARYLHIAGPFYIFFSTMFVFSGLFRGAGDTVMPMILTLLSLWVVRLPVARVLSSYIGVDGIWWSFSIGWLVGWGLSIVYYFIGSWKKHKLIHSDEESLQVA